MKIKYYKALTPDLKSFYDKKTKWKIGKIVKVKNPDTSDANCSQGIHLGKTIWDCFVGAKFPCRMFEAEPIGKIYSDSKEKIRCQGAKLIKEIRPKQIVEINKEMKRIEKIKWFKPRSPDKKTERIVKSALDAFGVKAKLEYRTLENDAAWDAARDAAFIIVQDLPEIKKKYPKNPFKYLTDLWELGYYVSGVSDGKFILYYVPLIK